MKKRALGNTGIEISPIGMGCWAYGGGEYWGEQSQKDVNRIVHRALELGINIFDTAEMYNDGASEASLGIALRGKREKAVVCSKVSPSNSYYKKLKNQCDASLKRLGTDYIDIYMLHWPINRQSLEHFTDEKKIIINPPSVEEAFGALHDLKEEGKIRQIGVSNFGVSQMQEAQATGVDIVINEMPYNILSRAIEKSIMPYCIKNGIGIIGSMALQQGILAGIYSSPADVPPAQAHSRHFHYKRGNHISRHGEEGAEEEVFKIVKRLKKMSDNMNIHIAQFSIAWVLAKPGIKCTLVGSRTISELESNYIAGDLTLDKDIVKEIDSISQHLLDIMGCNADYYESTKNSRIR